MKIIAVEEHFVTEGYVDHLCKRTDYPRREMIEDENHDVIIKDYVTADMIFTAKNKEFGVLGQPEKRLKEMDTAGIDMQILSLGPLGIESFNSEEAEVWAKKTNDELAGFINKYPGRFAGLAKVPWQNPSAAVAECERAVKSLGFKGIKVDSNVCGEYLDDKKYWPVFEKATELDVPINIHPREPASSMIKPFLDYPAMSTAMWGYGAEVGLHVMRLMCSGLFDEFPSLKIVIGHMGEAIPFWLWRIDNVWKRTPAYSKFKKTPAQYIRDNLFVNTSGLFSASALTCTIKEIGIDNILFAVDYPFESSEKAVQFLKDVQITENEREKISHLTAEKLFKL